MSRKVCLRDLLLLSSFGLLPSGITSGTGGLRGAREVFAKAALGFGEQLIGECDFDLEAPEGWRDGRGWQFV